MNIAAAAGVTTIWLRPSMVPVPVRLATWGFVLASSLMVSAPVRVPSAIGVNVTDTVQVDPGASVFGARGHVEEVCA